MRQSAEVSELSGVRDVFNYLILNPLDRKAVDAFLKQAVELGEFRLLNNYRRHLENIRRIDGNSFVASRILIDVDRAIEEADIRSFVRQFNKAKFVTKRGAIDVGHICDIDCLFCYHRFEDRKKRCFLPKEEIMRRIRRDREEFDIRVTDFTGGEPTIHPDIVEIVEFAAKVGNPICIISHGQWRNKKRIEAIIKAGVYEFLLSIHGLEREHDALTNRGAFRRVLESIELLEKWNVKWRLNCVANRVNMKAIPYMARWATELGYPPYNVNFIVFSPLAGWYERQDIDFQAKHSELAPRLRDAITVLSENGIWANVRYYPMCMLPGVEQHITCFPQICYDPFEWDYRSYNDLNYGTIYQVYLEGEKRGIYAETPYNIFHNTWSLIQSFRLYKKAPVCSKCRLFLICDGLSQQYYGRFGEDELSPREGKIIRDPVYFRRKFSEAVGRDSEGKD